MATGGLELPVSEKSSSEECVEFPCSVCTRNVESEKFCRECGEYMCTECLQEHKRFTSRLTPHQLLDRADMKSSGLVERCPTHPRKPLYSFCHGHGQLCCGECIDESHRSCNNIAYIPELAKQIDNVKELQDVKDNMVTTIPQLIMTMEAIEIDISTLEEDDRNTRKTIKEVKQRIIKHLDLLEDLAYKELRDRREAKKMTIRKYLESLNSVISKMNRAYEHLDASKNKTKAFVYLELGKKDIALSHKLMKDLKSAIRVDSSSYIISSKLDSLTENVISFGKIVPQGQYNVRANSDKSMCSIVGICRLENGTTIITDSNNKKLKTLDRCYRFCNSLPFQCSPSAVCRTGVLEVAVMLTDLKLIQIVSISERNSMTASRSITLREVCCGLTCFGNNIFVACIGGSSTGYIRIYDKTSGKTSHLEQTEDDKKKFTRPVSLALSECDGRIFVADKDKGVLILDRKGQQISVLNDPRLKEASNVCIGCQEKVFVCCYKSGTVLQCDKNGTTATLILQKEDRVKNPLSLFCDTVHSELIIGMENCDFILVVKLNKILP